VRADLRDLRSLRAQGWRQRPTAAAIAAAAAAATAAAAGRGEGGDLRGHPSASRAAGLRAAARQQAAGSRQQAAAPGVVQGKLLRVVAPEVVATEGADGTAGLGRSVALHHRASISYQIHEENRCLYF
jgi:hypothetical protein